MDTPSPSRALLLSQNRDSSIKISDVMNVAGEKQHYSCYKQLAIIRSAIKPTDQLPLKIFNTNNIENIPAKKKSLEFEFNSIVHNNNSTEVICISSDSSASCHKVLTPKKSIVSNNHRFPLCRKSLFKTIIQQDLKNCTDKTEMNFSPVTFSTPVHANNLSKKNKITTVENNKAEYARSKISNGEDDNNISEDECDAPEEEVINFSIEKENQQDNSDCNSKTKKNAVDMDISEIFRGNLENDDREDNDKKRETICKSQKIQIEESLNHSEINNSKNAKENNLNQIISKLTKDTKSSKIPFLKKIQQDSTKKNNILEKDSTDILKENSYNKSSTPPAPLIISPSVAIHQILNNDKNYNLIDSNILSSNSNFKIIDNITILPPSPFKNTVNNVTVENDKTENVENIVTEEEEQIITKANDKTLSSGKQDQVLSKTSDKIVHAARSDKLLNEISFHLDIQLQEENDNQNIITNDSSTLEMINMEHSKINNKIDPNLETKGFKKQNRSYKTYNKKIKKSISVKNNKNSISPLDLRKKEHLSKKKNLGLRVSKELSEKKTGLNLQDYFLNSEDDSDKFYKLLTSADKFQIKNIKKTRNKNKEDNQKIRWPPNDLNCVGVNEPFIFQKMNELEAAKKQKRYSIPVSEYNNFDDKRVLKSKKKNNLNYQSLEKVVPEELDIYQNVENSINNSSFRWPTPPPALISNANIDKQNSSKYKDVTSPSITTKNLRKRKLSNYNVLPGNNELENIQPEKKCRTKKSSITNSIITNNNISPIILEENKDEVYDDPAAASQIWVNAANKTHETNISTTTKKYSRKTKVNKDNDEYLELCNNFQNSSNISKNEKRKLYARGESPNRTRQIKSSSSKVSTQSDDAIFKKPLKPAPKAKKEKKKNEISELLKIHPMFKLSEEETVNTFIDKNGNEVRRSSRKKNEYPLYDLKEYCRIINNETKRLSRLKEIEIRTNLKKLKDSKNTQKKTCNIINSENNEFGMGSHDLFTENDISNNVKRKENKKSQTAHKITKQNKEINMISKKQSKIREIENKLEIPELFKDNTNLISKRIQKSKKLMTSNNKYSNEDNVKLNHIQNEEVESENVLQPIEIKKYSLSNVYVKLIKHNFTTCIQTNHGEKNNIESKSAESNRNKPLLNKFLSKNVSKPKIKQVLDNIENISNNNEMNNYEESSISKASNPYQNIPISSDADSNSEIQSVASNDSEKVRFFNWIKSFNCGPKENLEDNNELNISDFSEGYRLASFKNMIFERRKGVYYALYRGAITSGYMKLLPGIRKPKAKSGRFYLKFLVLAGHVNALINEKRLEFEPGDHIEVEKGQMYSIENKSNDVCCLYFTRLNSD